MREKINEWLSSPERLQTPYRLGLQRFVVPGQAESLIAEEFWNVLQELPTTEDYRIESSGPDERPQVHFDHFDGDEKAQQVVARLLSDSKLERIDELMLEDQRTNTVVSHRDVGIGISQVLPVLVHAYADRGQIVAIEQPEIHLHPALQAELGDVFIQSAFGEQQNTFILETHSEHLILRILRRVRETSEGKLPPGTQPVKPEDIAVVFVEPTAKGSAIRLLPVTPDGDFAVPWPGGFFAERFQDLP